MMRLSVAAACLAVALAGCTTVGGPPPLEPERSAQPPPAATIFGNGAFRTASGATGSCAGYSVALMLDTPRARDRMAALYGSTERAMAPIGLVKSRSAKLGAGGDAAQPVYTAQCDARGAFVMSDVISGGYFVIAHVQLNPARAGGPRDFVIMRALHLRPGEVRELTLAP